MPELCIIRFETVDEAFSYAQETLCFTTNAAYEAMMEVAPNNAWLCVLGLCDICSSKQIFFIVEDAFEDDIVGCECANCGNMSVYPVELDDEEYGDE